MNRRRQRLTLIAIAVLFFAPLVVAMLMQSDWWDYRPAGMRNAGLLVEPPLPTRSDVAGTADAHWMLAYPVPADCGDACEREITSLRQIHVSLGRDSERLVVALVRPGGFDAAQRQRLEEIYPFFDLLDDEEGTLSDTLDQAARRAAPAAADEATGWTYLLDPLGNVILAYPPPQRPDDIRRDLDRLMKYSKQDEMA